MKAQRHKRLAPLAALAALGAMGAMAPGLSAQEPLELNLKIRGGLFGGEMQGPGYHYDNKVMGLGLQAKRAMGAGQAVSVELTFEHVPGRNHDITDYALQHIDNPDHTIYVAPFWSFDNRKEYALGFSLLGAWHSKLPPILGADGFEWFAGLRLDRYKVRNEISLTLRNNTGLPYPDPTTNPTSMPPIYPGGNTAFNEEGASLVPGAFAGVKWQFNENMGFEMGLRYFGMKHYDFTAGAYLGKGNPPPYTEDNPFDKYNGGELKTGTTHGYAIEFAISCRL